jgi:type I site-specific restriction endonuclease
MTIRIIKGTTEFEGVPCYAGSSQDVIEGIDDKDGQRLIDLGYAEKILDPPKPPLQIFPESSEKIRNKIAELRAKLAEAEKEQAALIDDDLQDVAGITKRIGTANGMVSSLQALIQRQQAKLQRAETNEEMEAEKAAVKNLEKESQGFKAEAQKILDGILAAIGALETSVAALIDLRGRIAKSYYAAGGNPQKTCPMVNALALPGVWNKEGVETIKSYVSRDVSTLDAEAARMLKELQYGFNAKRHKTAEQLSAELQERERAERAKRSENGLSA